MVKNERASPDTLRIHTNSSKLLHVMILHLKALFEYALWPAVFDGTVRDRYGTGTIEGNTTPSTALMTAKKA